MATSPIFRLSHTVRRDPAVEAWLAQRSGPLGEIARHWFEVLRERGDDVREVLHDGHPTACVADAAFAYVNAFTAHVNVGFFHGVDLADPAQLLAGTGRNMRHVQLRPGSAVDVAALTTLVDAAYTDIRQRLAAE